MTEELKRCPFCRFDTVVVYDRTEFNGAGQAIPYKAVQCKHCGARTRTTMYAVQEWNTRPIEEQQAQRIKELEELLKDLLFAHENKDGEFPHQFETDAVNAANKALQQLKSKEAK